MEDLKRIIYNTLNNNPHNLDGVKFFKNYLEMTYAGEENLLSKFEKNVQNCPLMSSCNSFWNDVNNKGKEIKDVLLHTFDWIETPQGFEFWYAVSEDFDEVYSDAKAKNLIGIQVFPKRAIAVDEETLVKLFSVPQGSTRNPEQELLEDFVNYLSTSTAALPLKRFLLENNCWDEFKTNILNVSKLKGYEHTFKTIMHDGGIRYVIFWAFDWCKTTQGFTFWNNINDAYLLFMQDIPNTKSTTQIPTLHSPTSTVRYVNTLPTNITNMPKTKSMIKITKIVS